MEEVKSSYLDKRIEAAVLRDDGYAFVFQRARLKVKNELELQVLKDADNVLQKEIEVNDEEVRISVQVPETFVEFSEIKKKNELSRWLFSYQLIKKVQSGRSPRLHMVICPENIVLDSSLTPYFLHYGVRESLPPYEKNPELLLQELKAAVAESIDGQYTFEQYLSYHETLKLSSSVKSILTAGSLDDLAGFVQSHITELEKKERTVIHIPQKKWKRNRYFLIGGLIVLVPALVYTLYSLLFLQPREAAYVDSGKAFLQEKYSEVIDTLENENADKMPDVVQYELAYAYFVNEDLSDDQRKVLENTLNLQSDKKYYLYWIYLGRGENEKAIDIARSLRYQDLIMLGLIHYQAEIQSDDSLTGKEKEEKLKPITAEFDEYKRQKEAEKAEKQKELDKELELQKQQEEAMKQQAEKQKREQAAAQAAARKNKPESKSKEAAKSTK
ncbi:type VII secretion protein EssB [Actinomycetes bacterium NPDC127524]